MKSNSQGPKLNEISLSLSEFLESFNQNMPDNFPQASKEVLLKFKREHEALFRKDGNWSLDQHRKKVMDWLPRHIED